MGAVRIRRAISQRDLDSGAAAARRFRCLGPAARIANPSPLARRSATVWRRGFSKQYRAVRSDGRLRGRHSVPASSGVVRGKETYRVSAVAPSDRVTFATFCPRGGTQDAVSASIRRRDSSMTRGAGDRAGVRVAMRPG